MGLSAVRSGRVCDEVMTQLEGLIESGEWPVGSKIPAEPELVAALGVGRNTVREAVRALEHAGLLEPRRGDGTYVRATSGLRAAILRRAPNPFRALHEQWPDRVASLVDAAADALAR